MHGLVDMSDVILRYEMRLGQRHAITAQGLREQAEQLGLADTAEVIVLAPSAYADLATHVWPHAQLPLAGTRGIGEQMARLTALATGRTTIADLVNTQPGAAVPQATMAAGTGDEHAVSIRGGLVHLADTPPGRAGALAPMCPADQPGRRWKLTHAPITCTCCATIVARRRALDRWCAMVDRTALAADAGTAHRDEPAGSAPTEPKPGGQSGPAPCRPASRSGRRRARPAAPRRPGGTPRRRHRDGWRHVPARPYLAVPLTPSIDPAARRQPRSRYPQHPRPPIGRAPPRPNSARRARVLAPRRSPAGHRSDGLPLTPDNTLTRQNGATANRSANGGRRA